MNNSRDRQNRVGRAAIAGALVGGSAACAREWLTLIGVGAASLYLMDAIAKRGNDESA